jgi:cytidylate kinase
MKRMVIAISGLPGSGSTTIAKELARRFKLDYYSPGEVFKGYSKKNQSEAALEVWNLFGKEKKFHEKNFDRTQIEKAKKGNVVICGKLSIFMLKRIADYKIWIEGDLKTRAERTSERDGIPLEKALEQIKEREKIERESWEKIYGIDYTEQRKYADIVVENSTLTVDESVDKILNFIIMKEGK